MRSITFISGVFGAIAMPAFADLPQGCWARSYSGDHLSRQPDQVVSSLVLWIGENEIAPGEMVAGLTVTASDTKRTRSEGVAGQVLDQTLFCWDVAGEGAGCSVECDGGWMEFVRFDEAELVFSTNYLLVGDSEGCGGALDLSEGPGRVTRYLLRRVEASVCGRPE